MTNSIFFTLACILFWQVDAPLSLTEGDVLSGELPADGAAHLSLALKEGSFLILIPRHSNISLHLLLEGGDLVATDANSPDPLFLAIAHPGNYQLVVQNLGSSQSTFEIACVLYRTNLQAVQPLLVSLRTYRQGLTLLKATNRDEIERGVKQVLPLAHTIREWNEPFFEAQYWRALAKAMRTLGMRELELTYNQNALLQIREFNQASWLYSVLLYQGQAQMVLGDFPSAESTFREALQVAGSLDSKVRKATAYNELGMALHRQGWSHQALSHFSLAVQLWRDRGKRHHLAIGLQNIGIAFQRMGLHELALDYLNESYCLAQEIENLPMQAILLVEIGWSLYFQNHGQEAEKKLFRALSLAKETGQKVTEAGALDRLGTLLRGSGEYQQAEQFYRRALAIAHDNHDPYSVTHAKINLAKVLIDQKRYEAALEIAAETLMESRRSATLNTEVMGLYLQAKVHFSQGSYELARKKSEQALTLIHAQRAQTPEFGLRTAYTKTRDGFFRLHLDILMALNQHDQALRFCERVRGMYYFEPEQFRTKEKHAVSLKDLRQEIHALSEQRLALGFGEKSQDQRHRLESEIRRLLRNYDSARNALLDTGISPQFHVLNSPKPLTKMIQDQLGQRQLLIYGLGETYGYVWAFSGKQMRVAKLGESKTLLAACRRYYELVSSKPNRSSRVPLQRAARELAQLFLDPVDDFLKGSLIILPDGFSHFIPFAALPIPGTSKFLVEECEIRMATTLTYPSGDRQGQKKPSNQTFLAVGDPVYDESDSRLSKELANPMGEGRRFAVSGTKITPLIRIPGTGLEIEALSEIVGDRNITTLLGFEANLENVLRQLKADPNIIHFAVHGIANTSAPEISGLLFSTLSQHGKAKEGLLTAQDISRLQLNSELVTLSACQSGAGTNMGIQGHTNLAHAFFAAGCSAVLASLHDVNDQAGNLFMKAFYKNFFKQAGNGPAALRHAQLSMLKHPRYKDPYYWAPYIFWGFKGKALP